MSLLSRKPLLRYLLIALCVVLIDQAVKLAVKLNMGLGEEIPVIGQTFVIHFIENPGAAFGLTLSGIFGLGDEVGKLLLTLFSFVLLAVIFVYLRSVAHVRTALPVLMALVLGGAVGNLIDRTFYGLWFAHLNDYEGGLLHGRVVDMFYFDIWKGMLPEWIPLIGGQYYAFWPIFNVADACISCSIVAIIVFQRRLFAHHTLAPAAAPAEVSPQS